MKKIRYNVYTLLICLIAFSSACDRTEVPTTVIPGVTADLLRYDGPNVGAPFLPQGNYEAGVRFLAKDLQSMTNYKLTEVQLFIADIPDSCIVNIYRGSILDEPEELIYSKNITSSLDVGDWHLHELPEDIPLTNEDIWITVSLEHGRSMGSLGCDPGRAQENGDWLFDDFDGLWTPLTIRTGSQIDINWNIRGRIVMD